MQLLQMALDQLRIAEKHQDCEALQPAFIFRFDMRKICLLAGVVIVFLFLIVIPCEFPIFPVSQYRNAELQVPQPDLATTGFLRPDITRSPKSAVVFDTRPASSSNTDANLNLGRHELGNSGIGERRRFFPVGSGAYLFIEMAAYRGGPRDFSVVGLGSKPAHEFTDASFKCEWISASSNQSVAGKAVKILPEHWGFSRVYTVVVVSCSFEEDVGTASEGGELILYASPGASFDKNTERMVALREYPGDYDATIFDPPYPFEYAYCGSPLFGDISPQRIREWVSYHVKLFGPRSHFFFYDAGGIHPGVQKILQPWIDAGRITIENVRDQEQFDGYYHNQFLIVNDCLHKTRFLSNWTFFFDVDEFLYTPENSSLQSVLAEHSNFTQIFIDQAPMFGQLCLNDQKANHSGLWGFEKLIFKYTTKKGARRDRKYAIQPRNVYATGVHFTENLSGNSISVDANKLKYYHFHGTLSFRGEVCRKFVDPANSTGVLWFEGESFKADYSMKQLAASSKSFELEQVGEQPFLL